MRVRWIRDLFVCLGSDVLDFAFALATLIRLLDTSCKFPLGLGEGGSTGSTKSRGIPRPGTGVLCEL